MTGATFNVLADAYTDYGDYSYVDKQVLVPGSRTNRLVRIIEELGVDVIGLQEVEENLRDALDETERWQLFWSQKEKDKPDGCLTLVRPGINVSDFDTHPYSDGTGHILQTVRIGDVTFANTHIKWAPADDPDHIGVMQAKELLHKLGENQPAVIFADCNDKPGGPVRQLITEAGFDGANSHEPTALVNQVPIALDIIAVRGIAVVHTAQKYIPAGIPSYSCPSDHVPLVVELDIK